ncbi:MAG TPA: SRPBCC domain-containing protein [Trueperaceae bacterium]|nr:SRPBCC domain-containing protein [Trueperaceae bacterium]
MAVSAVQDKVTHEGFTIERRYTSSVDKVWNAFEDPQVKRRWFAEGEGFEVIDYGLDFRVGGREHASFNVVNAPVQLGVISNEARYFDIRDRKRISLAYSMSNDGTPFSTSLVTISFEADGSGTLLTFEETAAFFEGSDGRKMREAGSRSLLEGLAKELGEEWRSIDWSA